MTHPLDEPWPRWRLFLGLAVIATVGLLLFGGLVATMLALVVPVTPETKYSPFWPGDQIYFNNDIAMYYGLKSFSVTEYVE